jgi:enoyl-CoA hydratase/carnithine racemase
VNPLEQWLADAVGALGIGDAWSPADRDLVLDLARDVAHGVARPAAPLTSYLVGIAVGGGMSPAAAADRITALVAARPAAEAP